MTRSASLVSSIDFADSLVRLFGDSLDGPQMSEKTPFEDDEDDTPWASPEIRANYEAALGRFILAFNQIDNELTEIIETVLRRLKRDDLVKTCTQKDFNSKLLIFDLLKSSSEGQGIRDASVTLMREVNGERNRLAHGHFDQNPFDGTYDVVTKDVSSSYTVERLDQLTEKANLCWDQLRSSSGYYAFSDEPDNESAN
jgi:hypothetical protein